jgi:hypothetical protein
MADDARQKLILAAKRVAASEDGQVLLAHLSAWCLENQPTYAPDDTHHTAYNEGARGVMIHIRSLVAADLDEPKAEEAITEENEHGES